MPYPAPELLGRPSCHPLASTAASYMWTHTAVTMHSNVGYECVGRAGGRRTFPADRAVQQGSRSTCLGGLMVARASSARDEPPRDGISPRSSRTPVHNLGTALHHCVP